MRRRLGLGIVMMVLLVAAGIAQADPCLVVYPDAPCTYHYESAEYYTVTMGHPLYDPMYDRGGEVLIDLNDNEIAYDIYQAFNLVGFVLDDMYQGYFIENSTFDIVVDGWNNEPTVYNNVLLVFDLIEPSGCVPIIAVDGQPALFDPGLGWYFPIGALVVTTPTPFGNNYSDTITLDFQFDGCYGVRIYAFSDENFNLFRDGGECRSAFSHDSTVPVEEDGTWGFVKELYSR
jgi:hypothetical protein